MKKTLIIGFLFLTGCYEYIPDGVRSQFAAEHFLDTLYQPKKVEDKIGIGFITIKEYLNPVKQKIFQADTTSYYHLSTDEWMVFTRKVNDIVSKEKARIQGTIKVEAYKVNGIKYTTAFFVDSAFRKVFATIQLR